MAYAKIKVSSLPNTAYVAPPKPRPANRKMSRPITSSFARRRPPVSPEAESAEKAEPAQGAEEVMTAAPEAAV